MFILRSGPRQTADSRGPPGFEGTTEGARCRTARAHRARHTDHPEVNYTATTTVHQHERAPGQRHVSAIRCDTVAVDVHLRKATRADAEGVARVYVESWNDGFADLVPPRVLNLEQIARWSRDLEGGPVRWCLAESAGSVVGFAGTGPSRDAIDPDLGELDTIAVAPSRRRAVRVASWGGSSTHGIRPR